MFDNALALLAGRQCGVFSRAQALSICADEGLISWRLKTGRRVQAAPGVYALLGWPDSWHRRLWVAHLAVGPESVVSHEAAAALHGFALFPPGPVVVTVRHGDHHRPGGWTVHQSTDLRPEDIGSVSGLPVTGEARTLFDLAAVTTRQRYVRALEDAHVRRLCRLEDVGSVYLALRRRGKRGMKMLGQVLAGRGPGYAPPESELERRLLKVLARGGLPAPKRQYPLPWRGQSEARVDLAFPDHKVLLEADGRRWHSRMDQMAADRQRDREALSNGWRPYRFVWEEITTQPEGVCRIVRDALSLPSRGHSPY